MGNSSREMSAETRAICRSRALPASKSRCTRAVVESAVICTSVFFCQVHSPANRCPVATVMSWRENTSSALIVLIACSFPVSRIPRDTHIVEENHAPFLVNRAAVPANRPAVALVSKGRAAVSKLRALLIFPPSSPTSRSPILRTFRLHPSSLDSHSTRPTNGTARRGWDLFVVSTFTMPCNIPFAAPPVYWRRRR